MRCPLLLSVLTLCAALPAFAQQTSKPASPPASSTQIHTEKPSNVSVPLQFSTDNTVTLTEPLSLTLHWNDRTPSDERVHLDLVNATLPEALKQLFNQVKTKPEFELEKETPTDSRLTVTVRHIKFTTALDLITEM